MNDVTKHLAERLHSLINDLDNVSAEIDSISEDLYYIKDELNNITPLTDNNDSIKTHNLRETNIMKKFIELLKDKSYSQLEKLLDNV